MSSEPRSPHVTGLLYGVAAYGWWGFVAVYFRLVGHVPAPEILAHRIVWSVLVLAIIVAAKNRWSSIRDVLRSRRMVLYLVVSTVLIAVNWFVFIWSVASGNLLQASLGYYINPLVNVLFGYAFLGERLRTAEKVSVAIAALSVAWLTWSVGTVPWISLILAVTFALYGLVRKLARVPSLEGLTIETTILLPLAGGYLAWLAVAGKIAFGAIDLRTDILLSLAGIITALPLLWFAHAVQRLRLATVGVLQYISPTIQFLFAVFLFHEPFGHERFVAFAFIWLALAVYSGSNLLLARRGIAVPAPEPEP
ncbi:MAG: EamA family transporter RarD [Thermoanaerobaculia bacterium]|nr:EamA family transporter RarD [Thermoanaerobaculia bacterium]